MSETITLEPSTWKRTRHMVSAIVNRTNKKLRFEFFKGELTIYEQTS